MSRRSEKTDKTDKSLIINVSDLRKRLGQSMTVDVNIVFEDLKIIDTSATNHPVTGQINLESVERGVLAHGELNFEWLAECRRCLDPIKKVDTASVNENFLIDAPEDSELLDFDGVHVDLWPVVRDSVVFSLPLVPVCSQECPGPDPQRYPTTEQPKESSKVADPRWDVLDQLKFD